MKIKDLAVGSSNVMLEVEVLSVEEPRKINKMGKELRVANVSIGDETGNIVLTLWNENIDKVSPGMKIKIENGYVNEYQGNKQLTLGKFGTLTNL